MILDKALACSLLYEWSLLIQIMYEMDIIWICFDWIISLHFYRKSVGTISQSCFDVYIKIPFLQNSSNLKEIGNTELDDLIEEGFVHVKIKH